MLLREEIIRRMELTDLFTFDLKDEVYSECPALVLFMRVSKTNHVGRVEYAATMEEIVKKVPPITPKQSVIKAFYYF